VSSRRLAGPRNRNPLGVLAEYRRDPLTLFYEQALAAGGSVRLRLAHQHVYLLVEPDHIRQVLLGNLDNYEKGISYRSLNLVLGPGLLTSGGELWKRQRALIQPVFHRRHVVAEVPLMLECVDRLVERLDRRAKDGDTFDVVAEVMSFALDIVCRCVMGSDIDDVLPQIEADTRSGSRWVMRHMSSPVPLPLSVPTPANRRMGQILVRLHGVVDDVIRRQRDAGDHETLLGRLLAARDDDGHAMDDQQLRHEVLTFLLAGHETTAETIAWTLYELGRNPAVERAVSDELEAVLGGEPPSADDLDALDLTGRVIEESMRLHPPAWAFSRTALGADHFDRFDLPKGAIVVISPFVNHRLAEFWPSPLVFDPDRFTEAVVRDRPQFHYFPFGFGPHLCVGMHLAMIEVKVALAAILGRYHFTLLNGLRVRERPEISNMPSPVLVRVERRAD
jgi:cytochrome P450